MGVLFSDIKCLLVYSLSAGGFDASWRFGVIRWSIPVLLAL